MSIEILDRLAAADPAPQTAELPAALWSAATLRHVIDERRTDMLNTRPETPTTEPPPRRDRGMLVAAAAFAAVILLGAVIWATSARQGQGDVADTPMTTAVAPTTAGAAATTSSTAAGTAADPQLLAADIAFIELHMDTWFESGDFELAGAQQGMPTREGDGAGVSEVLYQAAIDAEVSVTDCLPLDETRAYACTVTYSNMLFQALGEPPLVATVDFAIIRDGLMAPGPLLEQNVGDNHVTAAWLRFEREAGLATESSCRTFGSNSVSCPRLQREHLDEFVAWWRAVDPEG